MEDKRECKGRRLSRRYEPNRVEEEVWALAYEQVWPMIRRVLSRKHPPEESEIPSTVSANVARSA
jgi:hypothetical protein